MKHCACVILMLLLACWAGSAPAQGIRSDQPLRIVSMNGAVSEMLCALGLAEQIVGVDVTSNYPASLRSKPRIGHNRNISAEGVLALRPTLILGLASQVSPALQDQWRRAKVRVVLMDQVYSPDGVRNMLREVAAAVGRETAAAPVLEAFDKKMQVVWQVTPTHKKVLFIYARGAGTLLVSGTGTSIDAMLGLAGARNAVQTFADFKPLSAESLVLADPDVILLFSSGLKSLGGRADLLKVPGVAQTRAGKRKSIIDMDGELLGGFGLRLPEAIRELHDKIVGE